MNCEMCGKEAPLSTVLVEGTQLMLCQKCAGHGKVLSSPKVISKRPATTAASTETHRTQTPAPVEAIVEDYAVRIRHAREKLGLNQKEFAARLNEKESLVHKLETGGFEPPIALARKLEKLLHITLVEQSEEQKVSVKGAGGAGMTIGDVIKF